MSSEWYIAQNMFALRQAAIDIREICRDQRKREGGKCGNCALADPEGGCVFTADIPERWQLHKKKGDK